MLIVLWTIALLAGVGAIVWGAEIFAENLNSAATRLGVASFALALLLAGAEPEELATVVVASFRGSPGIALGDVIGANVTVCLVALGLAAVMRPLPFSWRAIRYGGLGLPLGAISVWLAWDGDVSRLEGSVLVFLYFAYVAVIWAIEKSPPALGEVAEGQHSGDRQNPSPRKVGRELVFVLAGVAAMSGGATLLVEAVRRISNVESIQTQLGLTIVGFATGFELVVLAWSAARRGAGETVIAGVVGSFAYNVTMTLGAGAVVRPLILADASTLHVPLILMVSALGIVILLAIRRRELNRRAGVSLLVVYGVYVAVVVLGR